GDPISTPCPWALGACEVGAFGTNGRQQRESTMRNEPPILRARIVSSKKRASTIAHRTLRVLGVLSFVPLVVASHPALALDLSITGVGVRKGLQPKTNTIALVPRRTGAVRAPLGVGGTANPVAGVTGQLHVFVNGTEITPAAGVAPINAPFIASLAPQRTN